MRYTVCVTMIINRAVGGWVGTLIRFYGETLHSFRMGVVILQRRSNDALK